MNFYQQCADILELLLQKKGNFKTILFDLLGRKKLSSDNFRKTYSIIIKTVAMNKALDELLDYLRESNTHFTIQNKALLKIMMFEMLFGTHQKIKGGGKVKRFLADNEKGLRARVEELRQENKLPQLEASTTVSNVTLRRNIYLRLVKSRTSLEKLKEKLQDKAIENSIEQDDLIPNLLKMSYETYQAIRKAEDYKQSDEYIVQSKSSCFPATFLTHQLRTQGGRIKKKVDMIDSCSAPGNKTTQLGDYWPNGRIFALERDPKRFKLLSSRVDFYGFENIECIHKSFLNLDPTKKKFRNVRYVLVDPTCSGSGMLNNLENKGRTKYTREDFEKICTEEYNNLQKHEQEKVKELGNSQLELLDHAAKFPNVLRISFSTCSIYTYENEDVVRRFLEMHPEFMLVNLSKHWQTNGFSTDYADGYKCLRADPVNDEMDGFFVALFKKRVHKNKDQIVVEESHE